MIHPTDQMQIDVGTELRSALRRLWHVNAAPRLTEPESRTVELLADVLLGDDDALILVAKESRKDSDDHRYAVLVGITTRTAGEDKHTLLHLFDAASMHLYNEFREQFPQVPTEEE